MEEKSINKKVGKEIRMIRLSKNLSQEAVADELNISTSTLSNLERGNTEFTIARLYQTLSILKVTVFDFFKRIDKEGAYDNSALREDPLLYTKTERLEEEIRQIKAALEQLKNK